MTFTASFRRARTFVLLSLAAILMFTGVCGGALAQDRSVFVGNRGGKQVQVDLSVLDGNNGMASVRQRDLLFPGSTYKPGQRIILRRPGTGFTGIKLRKPRRRTARRSPRRTAPAPRIARKSAPRPVLKPRSRRTSAPPPVAAKPAAKSQTKPKKKMPTMAKVTPKVKPKATPKTKPRTLAKVVTPRYAKPIPKSRATANLKAPSLARHESKSAPKGLRPPATPKPSLAPTPKPAHPATPTAPTPTTAKTPTPPKPTSAPTPPKLRPASPPTPAKPEPTHGAIPAPTKPLKKPTAAPRRLASVPAVPPVASAPRTPVASTTLAKKPPAKAGAISPRKQVASIPRLAPATSGSRRRILFAPGATRLDSDGKATLGPVSTALAKNHKLRVELKAYARGNAATVSQARRLSLSRALAIRSYLIKHGTKATRIDVRALGSKVPDGAPNRVDLLLFTR